MAHFCPGKYYYNNISSGSSLARRRDTTRQPVDAAAAVAARFLVSRAVSSGCEKVRLVGMISDIITDFRRRRPHNRWTKENK